MTLYLAWQISFSFGSRSYISWDAWLLADLLNCFLMLASYSHFVSSALEEHWMITCWYGMTFERTFTKISSMCVFNANYHILGLNGDWKTKKIKGLLKDIHNFFRHNDPKAEERCKYKYMLTNQHAYIFFSFNLGYNIHSQFTTSSKEKKWRKKSRLV